MAEIKEEVFKSKHRFGDKVYTLEENAVKEYKVYQVIFCDYSRDEWGNECARFKGGYDIEYGIELYDKEKGKTRQRIITKNDIGNTHFWTKEDLLKSL